MSTLAEPEVPTAAPSAVVEYSATKGDKAARAARLELVTLRTALEKKRAEIKAPALERCRVIDAEANSRREAAANGPNSSSAFGAEAKGP